MQICPQHSSASSRSHEVPTVPYNVLHTPCPTHSSHPMSPLFPAEPWDSPWEAESQTPGPTHMLFPSSVRPSPIRSSLINPISLLRARAGVLTSGVLPSAFTSRSCPGRGWRHGQASILL